MDDADEDRDEREAGGAATDAAHAMTVAEEDAWLAGLGFVIASGPEDGEEGERWFLCDVGNGVPIGAGFPSRADAVAAARLHKEWHDAEVRLQEEIRAEFGSRRDDG